MSGLDLAAGIIGCVTITLQSAKVVYTTISELRDAPKTVEDLGSSVQRLYSVLEVILSREEEWRRTTRSPALVSLSRLLKDCQDCLSRLQSKMEPYNKHSGPKSFRGRLRAFMDSDSLSRYSRKVGELTSSLNLQLHVFSSDQTVRIQQGLDKSSSNSAQSFRDLGQEVTSGHKRILMAIERSNEGKPTSAIPKDVMLMPFPRDPKFVGREDTLAAIDAAFENAHTLHRVALCGLGGVGKSQIAIEYAHRRRERTKESVFWIYASSLARFTEGLEALAERLELPGWNEPKIDKLSLVSKWLSKEESGDWLLILDNIDDVSLVLGSQTGGASSNTSTFVIPQYLPQRGTILITSRSELAAANLVYDNEDCLIKVKPMSAELCKTLLKSKVGSKKLFDADADDQIIELVQELDCIPLAVTQAAAYLSRSRTTVAEYLLDFRSGENEQTALLSTVWNDLRRDQDAAGDSGMNMNAIIKTWQTSFNQIRARHGAAADLLSRMSMFNRQSIHWSICFDDTISEREKREVMDILIGFSFVREEQESNQFGMHRLVQVATRSWLRLQGDLDNWINDATSMLANRYPKLRWWAEVKAEHESVCRTLEPHVQACVQNGGVIGEKGRHPTKRSSAKADFVSDGLLDMVQMNCPIRDQLQWATLMHSRGEFFYTLGQWAHAMLMLREAWMIRHEMLGENDDDTLTSLAELGVVACDAGHLKDGVARQERAYHGLVGKYGPDARIVHECAHNLAWNYTDVGRHEDAETLAWRAVEWCRSHLGLADPFTTQTVRTLSTVYEKQHRSQDAEKLVKEALEAVQDQESRCTLKLTLANSYSFQERNEEACELFNEVLNHRKQTLGPQHPKSLQTAAHLAVAYWHDGRFGEAEQLEVELLRIQVQAFGPDDRFTLNTMYGLALTYHSQGRLQEAVNLLTEAVTLEQKTGREPANEYCALLHEWQHELDSSEDLISDKSCQ